MICLTAGEVRGVLEGPVCLSASRSLSVFAGLANSKVSPAGALDAAASVLCVSGSLCLSPAVGSGSGSGVGVGAGAVGSGSGSGAGVGAGAVGSGSGSGAGAGVGVGGSAASVPLCISSAVAPSAIWQPFLAPYRAPPPPAVDVAASLLG